MLTDPLTGLGNRAKLFASANCLMEFKSQFALIYIDLDSFKAINDNYGHQTGDQYLKTFGETLQKICGENEVFRISGDEFVCLSNNGDCSTLLGAIHNATFSACANVAPFFGFSLGCSLYPSEGKTLDELILVADSRMYSEKRSKH